MDTTITPSSLEQQKPIIPIQPVDNNNYQSIFNDAISSLPRLQENVTTAQGQQDTAITDYLSTLNNQSSLTDISNQADQTNNVQSLQDKSNLSTAELNRLSAQGSVLARQAQAIPLQIQQGAIGQGVTDRGVQPQETAALRENAIKALTIASQADIVQSQAKNDLALLTNAQTKQNRAIDLSYTDQQNKLAAKKANIDLISTYRLTPAQKEIADVKGLQIQFAQEKLKQDIADRKQISDMVINAISQGANNSGVDTAKAMKARTPAEAAQILGEYAGDYFKVQQLREAIKASRTENAVKGAEADVMLSSLGILPDSQVALKNVLDAIALKESAGSGDYKAIGPVVPTGLYKGQKALGRYQVMPGNLPEWSKAAVGRVVSPQEFLASQDLQDQIAGYQFLKNKQKYGTWEDAASVWFTGKPASEGSLSKDVLGTTGAGYVQSFRDNLAKIVGFTGGTNQNETTLKPLAPADLTKLNSTPQAKQLKDGTNFALALNAYKNAISTYGTGELLGKGSGQLNSAYQTLVGSIKDYYTLGTLDNGVEKLIGLGIPKPSLTGIKSSRISAIDTQLEGIRNQIENAKRELNVSTYKNSTEAQELIKNADLALTRPPSKPILNKFSTGLGTSAQIIGGSQIVNNIDDGGNINFTIPQ